MEITEFVQSKTIIPLADLTSIAANRAAFGDDVLAGFRTQVELRSASASAVLTGAEQAGRDSLLASEQRLYDGAIRERDNILSLQHAVERRTEQRAHVPATQVHTETRTEDATSAVLTREQRMSSWLQTRGGYAYQGEQGTDGMRLGAIVAALATGNRSRLTDLERRALAEGTDSTGGFMVPEILASRFIDRVRDRLVVQRAGAQIVPMTSDTLHLARVAQPGISTTGSPVTNAAVGGWKLENDLIDESDLTLERVTLTARTLPILLKMSVELFEDAANISEVVEREMSASTSLELDRVALVGSGTPPEPRGIINTAGVQTDTLGTPTDWDFFVDGVGLLWAENFEPNAAVVGTAQAIAFAKFKAGTGDNTPLAVPPALAGIQQYRSNAAGNRVFIADWSNLLIGMRTSFRIEVSRTGAGAFERLQVAVRSYIRADVAVAHPEAFVVLS